MKRLILLLLLGGVSLAKTLPGQAPAQPPQPARLRLAASTASPKDFTVSGDVTFEGKSGLKLAAQERGTVSWVLPEALAGKTVEIRCTATIFSGEAEVYAIDPKQGVTMGQQTIRRGSTCDVRVAARLSGKAELRLELQPRTRLVLSPVRVFVVERKEQ